MVSFSRGWHDPLLFLLFCLISVLLFVGIVASVIYAAMPKYPPAPPVDPIYDSSDTDDSHESDKPVIADTTTLGETPDAGQSYLDSIVFFGESTTSHWIARGHLSGDRDTTQVWTTESGTFTLKDITASTLLIRYPETGAYMTLSEAAALKKPEVMILTVGINGVTTFCKNEKSLSYYEAWYQNIIDVIRLASPETKIIIQSSFPINSSNDDYLDVQTVIHEYIPALNQRAYELAKKNGLRYLNTGEILKDASGELAAIYDNGDGLHLTTEAYAAMKEYIRTHAWID